jgi:hypothetical protein
MDGLVWGLAAIQILVCILIAWGVPESPKYLYEKGKHLEFNQSVRWMAKVNGKSEINVEEIIQLGTKSDSPIKIKQIDLNSSTEVRGEI